MKRLTILIAIAGMLRLTAAGRCMAAENGLGEKPYMGWSSWSCFAKNIDEAAIVAQADAMAERLKPFGYTYINLDAGWHNDLDFDTYGRRLFDTKKFPHGIRWLADYVHSKGLKFGLYIEPGLPQQAFKNNHAILGTPYRTSDIATTQPGNTLGKNFYLIDYGKPGAAEWVQSSADLLASWDIDFIKIDFVGPSNRKKIDNRPDLEQWSSAFRKTGRPVWIELSNNLSIDAAEDWRRLANGWRIDPDIEAHKPGALTDWAHIVRRFRDIPKWVPFAGRGGWSDLDSLELGSGNATGLTLDERRTMMTLWCISCSPLYLGTDLTKLDADDFTIITNSEAIAINQAGVPATLVAAPSITAVNKAGSAKPATAPTAQAIPPPQVWRSKNADGSWTVALFNLADARATVAAKWCDLDLNGEISSGASAVVRDLWSHSDLGEFSDGFSTEIDPHACRLLKVTLQMKERSK